MPVPDRASSIFTSSENDKLSSAVKQDKESEQNLTAQNSETEINELMLDELD